MQKSFMRQAEHFRRSGDDGRAAFWEAMANGVAEAAGQKPGNTLESSQDRYCLNRPHMGRRITLRPRNAGKAYRILSSLVLSGARREAKER